MTTSGFETTLFRPFLDGIAVFEFTISVVPENIKELMAYAQFAEEDIDTLCLHQANKQIILSIGEAVNFPVEKVPYYAFENYGNNTMCSVPSTICSVLKEKTEGGKITIIASGFGNGLSCASCILELDYIYNSGIITYQKADYIKTREDHIEYWLEKIHG